MSVQQPPSGSERVREVFADAMQQPAQGRGEFVDRACAGDAVLRDAVMSLVQAMERASAAEFLSSPTVQTPSSAATIRSSEISSTESPGTRIGPYKILQLIGEGGFGSVFMAEQSKPVERRVALKIIKLGMDTRQVIARFEAERQALAMMDHPNIARVLDAGATETGRPYFVMELVKGDPITEYCDKQNLSIDERLELFAQVCNAVQHAHQKGIIHRDIKPSNVLVSTQDGRPYAKVIDFGIAKATAARLTDKTLFTEHRTLIGTPEYMSPEQAEGSMDIDTRTDVYSLGVLLYELLTGATPFDSEKLRSAAYGEMQRIIREVDPPNPSTRLSQSLDTIANVAAHRHTEPKKLGSIIRGELDWIVMKALEKDRARRYETANGLAADIRRYLAGEAVVAAPPSTGYRLKKFIKRNKGVVVTGSLVAAALLVGVIAFAWQAKIAREQRDIAISAEKSEAEQRRIAESQRAIAQEQRNLATQEAARAKATSKFLEQMLIAADPASSGSREMTVIELLNKASAKAGKTLKDQPMVEASARTLLGNTFRSLGRIDEATAELNRAMELRSTGPETNTFPHAETLRAVALALEAAGDRKSALERYQQAQVILLSSGEDHAREAVIGYQDLARTHLNLSQFPETEEDLAHAEDLIKTHALNSLDDLAIIASLRASLASAWKGDFAQAEALEEQALALHRQADDVIHIAESLNNLAVVKMSLNKYDQAVPLYQEAINIIRREFGENNQRTALYTENLANVYYRQQDYPQALSMLDQVLKIRESIFGLDSMPAARTRLNMASVAINTEDYKTALALTNAAQPIFLKNLGEKNLDYAVVLRNRAAAFKGQNDLDGALREYQAALAIFDAVAAPTVTGRIRTLITMVEIQCMKGQPAEAQKTADLGLKVLDPSKPAQAKWIKEFQDQLAKCGNGPATFVPTTNPSNP